MNTEEFRCTRCNKKFFESNLALLVQKQRQEPGETPQIRVKCSRCDFLNVFVYEPSRYVFK